MGEEASYRINNFISGKWGVKVKPQKEYPRYTKASVKSRPFHIVEITKPAHHLYKKLLVVCDNTTNEDTHWLVWASNGITGVRKDLCSVVHRGLPLETALKMAGRKPYKSHQKIHNGEC